METYYKPQNSFKPKLPKLGFKFSKPNFKFGLLLKILAVILLVFLVTFGVLAAIYVPPAKAIYDAAQKLQDSSYGLRESLKTQDIETIELNLKQFKDDYGTFKDVYAENSPKFNNLPVVRDYKGDVDHLMTASDSGIELGFLFLDTLKPYAEDLGLKKGSNLTNEQKIQRLASVLPKLAEEVDSISKLLIEIDAELQQIDTTKYPDEFRGIKVREQLVSLQTVTSELAIKSPQFKSLFEQLPALLGVNEPVTYLAMMANATELRMATGGFPTYAVVVTMDNGIPTIEKSVDTYFIDVDNYILENRNVPQHLRNELKVNRLYARDAMNVQADLSEGVELFMNRYWNLHPGTGVVGVLPDVDAVVLVNTHLAEDLLEVLGPVDVQGRSFLTDQGTYKGFDDTEFNSTNIIYNLEVIANSELSEIAGRKDIIKFLLESILNKVLNANSENILPLSQTFLEALGSKDIMVHSFDPAVQAAMEELNYAGKVNNAPNESWDYMYLIHNNYGGGKRNWLVKTETSKVNSVENGKKVSTVTVKVDNPNAPEWWSASWLYTYKDYVLMYVPKGSTFISANLDGESVEPHKYSSINSYEREFFDFTVWVDEGKSKTLTVKYQLPDTVNFDNYNLLIQKQPGTHGDTYSVTHNNTEKRFTLNSDIELSFE